MALVKGDFVSGNNSHLGCRAVASPSLSSSSVVIAARKPPPPPAHSSPPSSSSPRPPSARLRLLSGIAQLLLLRRPLMGMVTERAAGFISRGDFAFDARRSQSVDRAGRSASAYYFNHRARSNHVCTLGDKLILEGTWRWRTTLTTISTER